MVWDSGSLKTRQFARRSLAVPVRIEFHPDHAGQLRLAFPEEGGRPTLVDLSEGGLGLHSRIFLPRNARMIVHIPKDPAKRDADNVTIRAVVRRCAMVDIRPTFHVGLQYLEPQAPEIKDLLARTAQSGSEATDAG